MQTRFQYAFSAAVALAAIMTTPAACAEKVIPVPVDSGTGFTTALDRWEIQSSAKVQQTGAEVSASGFSTRDWYPVSGRATVMAGLLENGKYPDVFYSDNLRAVE